MSAEKELRRMIEFLNEKVFEESGASKLELRVQRRPDLGGVLVFMVLVQGGRIDIGRKTVVIPVPSITLCWGAGNTAESACETALRSFAAGNDLVRRFLPFTAGSLDELKLKAAAYYG